MNVKTIIQILILVLIAAFIYFFINNTFQKEEKNIVNLDLNKDEIIKEIDTEKNDSNIIENLNYISIDAKGNKYILSAEYGKESMEDPNIIILEQVAGIIKLTNRPDIEIKSDFAKYNSITFDTSFYDNVSGLFEESKIYSDNLDLYFKNNKAIMYNNIKYFDQNTIVNADEIIFNLLNGDVNVKMFDKTEKIQIIKN